MKFCVGILVKELLVFSVKVNSLFAGGGDINDDTLSISLNTKRVYLQHVGPATISVNRWMKGIIILLLGLRLLARATASPAVNPTYNRC